MSLETTRATYLSRAALKC